MYKGTSRYFQHSIESLSDRKPNNYNIKIVPPKIIFAAKDKSILTGFIVKRNKGGFIVMVCGFPSFCPKSHMYPMVITDDDYNNILRRKMGFTVLEASLSKVVVSRRLAAQMETVQSIKEAKETNTILKGTVKNIKHYGVFVSLGPVDGFVHISKLSKNRITNINEHFKIGQKLNLKVLEVKNNGERISLTSADIL